MQVFVSYTTRDSHVSKWLLSEIAEVISRYGAAFIDLLHNDSPDKQSRIESEISRADLVILLNTRSYPDSPWTQEEKRLAMHYGRKVAKLDIEPSESMSITLHKLDDLLKEHLRA